MRFTLLKLTLRSEYKGCIAVEEIPHEMVAREITVS